MKSWQEIAKEVQQYRDDTIAQVHPPVPTTPDSLPRNVTRLPDQLLPDFENEITKKPPEELIKLLTSRKISCVEVTNAFLRRAGLAQRLVNCVTEILSKASLQRAQYLDNYFLQHGKPIGPLHGLPISVKEHIAMAGLTLSDGYVGWYDRIAAQDAHVLQLLWNAGAVFFVRTNEPQLLMHLETSNNLYGTTVNPYNRDLTCGGSSGGEGALLALRGSCLGLGTDIGGSVRSPAANCGVWSFRPSTYRIPDQGADSPVIGEEQIVPVLGPMSTSFEGLGLFMKTVIDQKPWLTEPSLLPLPWMFPSSQKPFTKSDGKNRLKIGVMWHDNVVRPHPPVTRALKSVIDRLHKVPEEFEIVYWNPLKHDEAWDLIAALYFPDGGKAMRAPVELTNEPWLPLSRFIVDEQPTVREYSLSEVWQLTNRREIYRAEYAAHWNSTGDSRQDVVDVILCPVGPGAAPPLNHARYWGYTSTWNLLDYPAMVFPVTHVDEKLDRSCQNDHGYEPMNKQDAWNWQLWTDGGAARYRDAPISLQLVGRRWQDEKVFEAMEMVKDALGI